MVIFCGERPAYNVYINGAKDGLAAQLKEDDLSGVFTKIDSVSDDHVSVWRLP